MKVKEQQPAAPSAARSLFSELLTVEEYFGQFTRPFANVQAGRWYIRKEKLGLEACGALLRIQGRLWIRPKRFDAYVLKEGAAAMKREAA